MVYSYGDPMRKPDNHTGACRLDGRKNKPWAAYVNGDMLRARDGTGRLFATAAAADRAIAAAKKKCGLCARGFGHTNGIHHPSQRLGMIPDTPCSAQPIRRAKGAK